MIEEEGFTEKWREVPGFPGYWVSDTGRVLSMKTKKVIKSWRDGNRKYVSLLRDKRNHSRRVSDLRERAFGQYFERDS